MHPHQLLRFVLQKDVPVESSLWGPHYWLSRPGLTDAKQLMLVRVNMPAGKAHPFHVHPEMEEIIYVLSGEAEQWVDQERQILGPGEIAHIPKGMVHGTYNNTDQELQFLAVLSPADSQGPLVVEKHEEQPWCELREALGTA